MKSARRLLSFAILLSALSFAGQSVAQSVIATIPSSVPEGVDVNPLTRLAYAANFFTPTVSVIDERTHAIVDTITFPRDSSGNNPEFGSVAVNPATSRLYATDPRTSLVYVVDTRTKQIITRIPVCNANGLAVNPRTDKIYVSGFFCNTVQIINGKTNTVTKTIAVPFARKAAVDIFSNRIYVPSQNFNGAVFVLDGNTDAVLAQISSGRFTTSVGVDFRRHLAYASNEGFTPDTNNLAVIDTNTNTVIDIILTDQNPTPVAVDPFTNRIFVATAFQSQNVVDVIDGKTRQIINRIPIDPNASDAAIDPVHGLLYISSPNFLANVPGGNVVTVINVRHGHGSERDSDE